MPQTVRLWTLQDPVKCRAIEVSARSVMLRRCSEKRVWRLREVSPT